MFSKGGEAFSRVGAGGLRSGSEKARATCVPHIHAVSHHRPRGAAGDGVQWNYGRVYVGRRRV